MPKGVYKRTEEHKRKLSESHKGKEGYWKGKVGPNKGLKTSEETKKKIRNSNKGKPRPTLKGNNISEDHKRKIKDNHARYWKNKVFTDEHKIKIGEANKDNIRNGGCSDYWHKKAWELFGKDYCETCYMSNEEHKKTYKCRLHMHNMISPDKNYSVIESYAWKCLCGLCHGKLESLNN